MTRARSPRARKLRRRAAARLVAGTQRDKALPVQIANDSFANIAKHRRPESSQSNRGNPGSPSQKHRKLNKAENGNSAVDVQPMQKDVVSVWSIEDRAHLVHAQHAAARVPLQRYQRGGQPMGENLKP
jgi:hypothetical protein